MLNNVKTVSELTTSIGKWDWVEFWQLQKISEL